jgi:hypothetical protein
MPAASTTCCARRDPLGLLPLQVRSDHYAPRITAVGFWNTIPRFSLSTIIRRERTERAFLFTTSALIRGSPATGDWRQADAHRIGAVREAACSVEPLPGVGLDVLIVGWATNCDVVIFILAKRASL